MIQNAHYDEKLASVHDLMYATENTSQAVEFLADLCPAEGTVLELGVGTGRIALPLAERGLRVSGIDGSDAMLTQLKQRDTNNLVDVHLGDFTKVGIGRRFDLVTILLSTFYAAVTREQQLACIRNVGEQLAPQGRFVVEAFDPALFHGLTVPQFSVRHLSAASVMLDTYGVDRSQQLLVGTHTILDGGPPATSTHVLRYAFPSELDLLAELCGLRLVNRWGGWAGEPYTAASTKYVSVYERFVKAD